MSQLDSYFSAISEEKKKLDAVHYNGCVFMTSVRNISKNSTPGCVSEVSTKIGARHMVDGTARESTPEEIATFKRAGELFAAAMRAADEKRNPAMGRVILMPDTRSNK